MAIETTDADEGRQVNKFGSCDRATQIGVAAREPWLVSRRAQGKLSAHYRKEQRWRVIGH
jgi:hypothetical protein